MKRFLAMVCLCTFVATSAGCGSWFDNFKKDPIGQTQGILNTIQTIIQTATLIFGQVKPLLPPAQQDDAQVKFDQAIQTVNHAAATAQNALVIAAEAKQDKPDLAKVMKEVTDAVANLQALVASFKGLTSTTASAAKVQASAGELDFQVGVLNRQINYMQK